MKKRLFMSLMTVVLAGPAMAKPLETVLEFSTKGVKKPKNIGGYELVRTAEYKKGEVETEYKLRVTWSFPSEDRVQDYDLESISGDEDYNEYTIKTSETEIERLGVGYVTIHNFLNWAHLSGDDFRLEAGLIRKKHDATVELTYTADAKKNLIAQKVFSAKRFTGDKVILNYRTSQTAKLITEQTPGPTSYCYRGKLEDAASLVEKFIVNADGDNGYTVAYAEVAPDSKATLHADYQFYDEDSEEKSGKLAFPPCK